MARVAVTSMHQVEAVWEVVRRATYSPARFSGRAQPRCHTAVREGEVLLNLSGTQTGLSADLCRGGHLVPRRGAAMRGREYRGGHDAA